MSKRRASVTLDEDLYAQIAADDTMNVSGTVNMLLRRYLNGDGEATTRAMLELREDQLESEIASLEADLETKREELARVRESLESQTTHAEDVVAEAVATLDIHPSEGHDHAAARNWAQKANLNPAEFWSRYTEAYDE